MLCSPSSSSPSSVQQPPSFAEGTETLIRKCISTELYESAMQEQLKREQQRRRMVKWRKQKKNKKTDMVEERRRLEKKLQRQVIQARVADDSSSHSASEAYRQLTIELAALTTENLTLKAAVANHVEAEMRIERETQEFLDQIRPGEAPVSTLRDNDGWCVQFPHGEPSFFFSPFTKKEFDIVFQNNDIRYAECYPCTATVGKILGWTVNCAPLVRNETGICIAHARFTKRLRCSIDEIDRVLPHIDKNLWPALVAPRSWGRVQTGGICHQLLQIFHENALVMVGNVPGEVHLRYIVLAQHTQEKRSDGRRVDKYILVIADSEANARNREAEGEQEKVQWVFEGGTYMTTTEVDEVSVDVVFDQWAGCQSELHGRELYVDWIRFPVDMEQYVSPARLLRC